MLIKFSKAYEQAEARFQAAQQGADELAEQVAKIREARMQLLDRADKAEQGIKTAEGDMRSALVSGRDIAEITARIASLTAEAAASRSTAQILDAQVSDGDMQLRGRYATLSTASKARDAARFSELARAWCEHLRDALPIYDALKEAAISAGISVNEGMGWAIQRNVPQVGAFALTADEAKPAPLR